MKVNILEADSVRCSFNERQLLTDVYLKCETGEIIGLLGRNGTGKSTLLKIIFGSQSSENNNIRYNRRPYKKNPVMKNIVAYLPQEHFLPSQMNVEKLIKLYMFSKEGQDKILSHDMISRCKNQKVDELSGGQHRFLEFLLLLYSEAEFLLLDEPFSAVEPLIKEEIKNMIKQNRGGKGFIITDHDYRHVLDICDHYVLIDQGICRHLKDLRELELYSYVPIGTFNHY